MTGCPFWVTHTIDCSGVTQCFVLLEFLRNKWFHIRILGLMSWLHLFLSQIHCSCVFSYIKFNNFFSELLLATFRFVVSLSTDLIMLSLCVGLLNSIFYLLNLHISFFLKSFCCLVDLSNSEFYLINLHIFSLCLFSHLCWAILDSCSCMIFLVFVCSPFCLSVSFSFLFVLSG